MKAQKKRGQGRPVAAENGVGRDALITATLKLLKELPPSAISISLIAREAGVDPALVRYYFGNREGLLGAVIDSIVTRPPTEELPNADTLAICADHIRNTFHFTQSTKYMHRLMIDELASAKSAALRNRVRDMNVSAIRFYDELRVQDDGEEFDAFDPLFLHLAVIGLSDFFVSAAPVIEAIVPPGTDMNKLAQDYESFVVKLVIDGLRKR